MTTDESKQLVELASSAHRYKFTYQFRGVASEGCDAAGVTGDAGGVARVDGDENNEAGGGKIVVGSWVHVKDSPAEYVAEGIEVGTNEQSASSQSTRLQSTRTAINHHFFVTCDTFSR